MATFDVLQVVRRGGARCISARSVLALVLGLAVLTTVRSLRAEEKSKPGAQPAGSAADFAHEIVPVLQKRCAKCHAGTQRKGGFSINTRQALLTGGETGPGAVPRRSAESALIERVASDEVGLRMPPEGERLTKEQVELLRRWVDAGLPWEDGFAFGKLTRQAPLAPRRPDVPTEGAASDNPVDRFLASYFRDHDFAPGAPVSDAVFARRAAFDLAGLPPFPQELEAFCVDGGADKRERFVGRLLDDRENYAAHWLTFWNDLLRNAYHGTGFIDGGRRQITGWLYRALYENKPYDTFVRELVSPPAGAGSKGFTYGIKWRGTVNESQRREIQAAHSVAQVFLGTNLKCASCHDSFVNHWKLTEAYALASVFAEGALEIHRCDKPTGVPAPVGFLYPQLGTIEASAPPAERQRRLAELLTHPENGRLARTIVNRLWGKLFGRGLVEPPENMDALPWHQDLLDFLATDLVDHGYDLKRTLRLLATSRAYQLPGVAQASPGDTGNEYVFRGPVVKRVNAEQFVDSVLNLIGDWPRCDAGLLKRDGRGQGGQLGEIARALGEIKSSAGDAFPPPLSRSQWVTAPGDPAKGAAPSAIWLRRVWKLEQKPTRGTASFSMTGTGQLFVNGKPVGKTEEWRKPIQVDVTDALASGVNVVGLKVERKEGSEEQLTAIGEMFTLDSAGRPAEFLSTDETWLVSESADGEWLKPEFGAAGWRPATRLGGLSTEPWKLGDLIAAGGTAVQRHVALPVGFRIRAALLPLDALQSALGRPNREQVVSARDAVPTLLQALQLTNGTTLGQYLAQGAATCRAEAGNDPAKLIDRVYRTALGRAPSDEERHVALEIVGTDSAREGIEDLLWTIRMLPEFQIIP